MHALPPALQAMGAYRQFIVYVAVPSKVRPGKTDKFPCDFRTGEVVSAHDANVWTDADTAIAAAVSRGAPYGVGFVFTEADPFWFFDLDSCLSPDGSDWSPHAKAFCNAFSGAAVEVSHSGKGLHIFGTGRPPEHRTRPPSEVKATLDCDLEFYHSGRFAALTGTAAAGDAGKDFTATLPAFVAQFFPPGADNDRMSDGWSDGPCDEWRGPTDDDELLRRALQSKSAASAFGGKATFADLWQANVEVLSKCWPDPTRGYAESEADAALIQHLAFWTGRDCERIERLMMRSGLYREKFERKDGQYGTYLRRSIAMGTARQFDVLTDKLPEPVAGAPTSPLPTASSEPPRGKAVVGSTFSNNEDQLNLFTGCVYVQDIHRVLVPGGVLLKPEQFKVTYGGYTFTLDNANEKTTRDPWEAFTQSQALRSPRASSTCFRPDRQPGELIQKGGQVFVNTYWPVDVPRKVGDAGPFLRHLAKVLPDERDRAILLYYMAACVQHKGVKFQWAPLLQGVEGNGKTLFTRCVAEAVGRRYVHWPKASKLAAQFNSWMLGKVFYGVEDIYVPDHKDDIFEELKPMITGGDGLEIEGKGVDQISADICGNFIFNSNRKAGLRKTKNDRRICPLFCAQQQDTDLKRDGMDGDYMPDLYDWLKADGYAIVSELLHTLPIPDEFNPATKCHRAPISTTTNEAIRESVGGVEQEIEEAIAQGIPGFCGGWISSIMIDRLLERLNRARSITHAKRKEMLEAMGFVWHPALSRGRVNNMVLPDAGKPCLFVKLGCEAYNIVGAAEAAKAYETANNHSGIRFPVPH